MSTTGDRDLESYRAEVREWVKDNLPPRGHGTAVHGRSALAPSAQEITAGRALQRKIFEAGYLGITVPVEYGGQGLSREHERIWYSETSGYAVPVPGGVATQVTLGIILPTIAAHGSEEQKRDWIPKMLSGEETWAQLLSEPAAGSDLAGIRTRATRDGDEWVINGAKVWSSGADVADYGICLARTDWDAPKHRGLTWFKVPLADSRVTVRPIREINGGAAFCEEFLDDVRVGHDMVIGEVNGGWGVTGTLLAHERAGGSNGGNGIRLVREGQGTPGSAGGGLPADLVALARSRGLENDQAVRQLIARAHINEHMQARLTERITHQVTDGTANPSAASLVKLGVGTVLPCRAQIAMEIAGRTGIAWEPGDEENESGDNGETAAMNYLNGRIMSIGGGSDQIQRNIIAERLLGLPREPSFDTDKPFREVLRDAGDWS